MAEIDLLCTQRAAIIAVAGREGIPGPIAERLAADVERAVCELHGGNSWYVRVLDERTARDRAIRDAYRRGTSITALAYEHGITERQVRRILAQR